MYSFSYLEPVRCFMSSSNCCFLICIQVSQRQVRCSGIPVSWRIFHILLWSTVKGFGIVNKAEVDIFLELLLFWWSSGNLAIWYLVPLPFLKPAWTSGSSRFVYCWSLAWRILSITFTSMWDECNWAFFGIAFLWYWNENWPFFPVLWPLLSFPNLLAYWVQHFHSIIF